jgi:hypothetical protein
MFLNPKKERVDILQLHKRNHQEFNMQYKSAGKTTGKNGNEYVTPRLCLAMIFRRFLYLECRMESNLGIYRFPKLDRWRFLFGLLLVDPRHGCISMASTLHGGRDIVMSPPIFRPARVRVSNSVEYTLKTLAAIVEQ